jgi:hypothetical protein
MKEKAKMNKPPFEYKLGADGLLYIIFASGLDAEKFDHIFGGYSVCCFDQYENAYCLS